MLSIPIPMDASLYHVCILKEQDCNEEVEEYMKRFIQLRKKLDGEVKFNVKQAQERQKKHYDAKHQKGCFKENQKVLLKNMKKLSKKGDKMAPNWYGPYEIAEQIGRNTYRLRKGKKVLKSAYDSTHLKPFYEGGT